MSQGIENNGRPRVAVVGTGISGNGAAWLLSQHQEKYGFEMKVYEQNQRVGGHSCTVEVHTDASKAEARAVDMGFIVYNELNYPNLVALFKTLGVETMASDMSWAVSRDNGAFEYRAGGDKGIWQLFVQPSNLVSWSFWSMILQIMRFNQEATAMYLDCPKLASTMSMGEFLDANGYDEKFRNDYLLPTLASIWSCESDATLSMPCKTMLQFMHNHGLLTVDDRPKWRTVYGGSQQYVRKLTAPFRECVQVNSRVTHVERRDDGRLVVRAQVGDSVETEVFDYVIMAGHADETAAALDKTTIPRSERECLSTWSYFDNEAVLHSDERWLPQRKSAWASWSYMTETSSKTLNLSYWMNNLQRYLPAEPPMIVTLNPGDAPMEKVHRRMQFSHPEFTLATEQAQQVLHGLQGKSNIWYAGSYTRFGFHEDGLRSGLKAAKGLLEKAFGERNALAWDEDTPAHRVGADNPTRLRGVEGTIPRVTGMRRVLLTPQIVLSVVVVLLLWMVVWLVGRVWA